MSYFCHSVTCGGRRQAAPVWLEETDTTIRQIGHAVVRALSSDGRERIAATPRQVALSDPTKQLPDINTPRLSLFSSLPTANKFGSSASCVYV